MEKQLVASFAAIRGSMVVYEDLPILQMRNEDFALPNAPEYLINCEDLDPLLEKIATRHFNQSMDLVKTLSRWGEEEDVWKFEPDGNDDRLIASCNAEDQGTKSYWEWQTYIFKEYDALNPEVL